MPLNQKNECFVFEPTVRVIAASKLNYGEIRSFLEDEGFPEWTTSGKRDGDVLCEVAGRVCYMSFDRGRPHADFIKHIKESGHGSVLEHPSISFLITGVSRSLTHELVRHRAGWAYSQLSQRFVDEKNARYVVPPWLLVQPREEETFRSFVLAIHDIYLMFKDAITKEVAPGNTVARKLVNGVARSVLPNATETKLVCTVNARAFRHFLERRAAPEADDEIRRLAMAMYRAALPHWPEILADYQVCSCERELPYLSTNYVKV